MFYKYYIRYKNLGDVKERLQKKGNKIILKMINGFYNNHKVSSVIEFICSNKNNVSIVNMNVYYILSKI